MIHLLIVPFVLSSIVRKLIVCLSAALVRVSVITLLMMMTLRMKPELDTSGARRTIGMWETTMRLAKVVSTKTQSVRNLLTMRSS